AAARPGPLPSVPTRRSSDLTDAPAEQVVLLERVLAVLLELPARIPERDREAADVAAQLHDLMAGGQHGDALGELVDALTHRAHVVLQRLVDGDEASEEREDRRGVLLDATLVRREGADGELLVIGLLAVAHEGLQLGRGVSGRVGSSSSSGG